jgi:hypothetical protein
MEFLDRIVDLDYTDEIYDEWYCINVKPFHCNHCKDLIAYAVAGPHMIIIWPERDDIDMLILAHLLKTDEDDAYDPRIVKYNRIFGPCIAWDDAINLGWVEQ